MVTGRATPGEGGKAWGVRLLDLRPRGLNPDGFVAAAGSGLRARLAVAFPEHPSRSDVFHALHEVHHVVTTLENKAYQALNLGQPHVAAVVAERVPFVI